MSLIDVFMLGTVLAVAAGWILIPRRAGPVLAMAPWVLCALIAVQLWLEGAYWQFAPAWLVILAATFLAAARSAGFAPPGVVIRIGLALMAGAALGPFAILPVPRLTPPAGPHAVGTEVFRLVDRGRAETLTADPADRRNLVVQAWYPAAHTASGHAPPYIDGLGRLPAQVSVLPGFVLRSFGRVDTHAAGRAPVSDAQPLWPVVIFSPGYGAPRSAYSSLVADLASRGFVVLSIDHPYESAVVELADGRVATPIETFPSGEAEGTAYMVARLDLRAADLRFVLERLSTPGGLGPLLSGRLDLERIAAAGHSFGGAASAVALDRDPRVKAAANIDGTLYGDIAAARLKGPFLLLESDHSETSHGLAYTKGNASLLAGLTAGGYRYEIARANHYSFTDLGLYLSPPARFAAARLVGGSRGPTQTHRATVDILTAFLRESLEGAPPAVAATAARYPDIAGGPVG